MIALLWLSSAFFAGLLSSGHCLVMCTPMTMVIGSHIQAHARLRHYLLLNLGRVVSYSVMGALFAVAGALLAQWHFLFAAALQLLAGVLLVAMALYVSQIWQGLRQLERLGGYGYRLLRPLQQRLVPIRTAGQSYAYGMLWGFLPCGLVYSNLSVALSSADIVQGSVWMFGFGLGTSVAMLGTLLAQDAFRGFMATPWLRRLAALLLSIYGFCLIYLALTRLVF